MQHNHLLLPLIVFKYDFTGLNSTHIDTQEQTVLNWLIQSSDTKLLCNKERQLDLTIKQLKKKSQTDLVVLFLHVHHGKSTIFKTLHGWSTLAHAPMAEGGTWDPAATELVDEDVGRLGPWYLGGEKRQWVIFIHTSSESALSWLGLWWIWSLCWEQWAQGMNTPKKGPQAIVRYYVQTHTHTRNQQFHLIGLNPGFRLNRTETRSHSLIQT